MTLALIHETCGCQSFEILWIFNQCSCSVVGCFFDFCFKLLSVLYKRLIGIMCGFYIWVEMLYFQVPIYQAANIMDVTKF